MCERAKSTTIIDLAEELELEELRRFCRKADAMDHSINEHVMWVLSRGGEVGDARRLETGDGAMARPLEKELEEFE